MEAVAYHFFWVERRGDVHGRKMVRILPGSFYAPVLGHDAIDVIAYTLSVFTVAKLWACLALSVVPVHLCAIFLITSAGGLKLVHR